MTIMEPSLLRSLPIRTIRAVITNAQIINLTIVEVVPAPRVNELLIFRNAIGYFDFRNGAYASVGGNCHGIFRVNVWGQSRYDESDLGALVDASDVHMINSPPLGGGSSGVSWFADFNAVKGSAMTFQIENDAVPLTDGNI